MLHAMREWMVSPDGIIKWSRFMPGLQQRLDRTPLSDLAGVRRLGVLRPDGMGDLVLTGGMLRELRIRLPDTRITLICQAAWAEWMQNCPWIDDVVSVEVTTAGDCREPQRVRELVRFIDRVWPLDLEVLLQPGTLYWYVPSRALALFSGAPVRVCWEDCDAGVDTGHRLHTKTLPFPNSWHEAEKCFLMLEAMGFQGVERKLGTWWTADDARHGEVIALRAGLGRRHLVALGLGGSEAGKRWPVQRYLDVVRDVGARGDVAFLALGGPDVADTCRALAAQAPDLITYPGDRLPLGVVWAAISRCSLYLGNDSGMMHMAAAAHVPVVVVVGIAVGVNPGTRGALQTGPYDTLSRVIRPARGAASDGEPDAALVSPAAVTHAALELLGHAGAMHHATAESSRYS